MPPQVILIRHGQALHNLDDKLTRRSTPLSAFVLTFPVHDWNLNDPPLTTQGEAQCEQLALDLQIKHKFVKDETLIVVSPLRRTLQSYQKGLSWLATAGVHVELRAEWQESTGNPCDVGTRVSLIEKEWPHLDFSRLDPVYPEKTGLYDPSEESLLKRAKVAREWLYHRPETHVIVMTHSGFIRRVAPGRKYANAEYRIYDFAEEDEEDEAREFKLITREEVHQSLETQQSSIK